MLMMLLPINFFVLIILLPCKYVMFIMLLPIQVFYVDDSITVEIVMMMLLPL